MVDVTIYTRPGCPYCTMAKELLTRKGVEFNEINAGATPELRAEMQARSGRNTFPRFSSVRFTSVAATIFMRWKIRENSTACSRLAN